MSRSVLIHDVKIEIYLSEIYEASEDITTDQAVINRRTQKVENTKSNESYDFTRIQLPTTEKIKAGEYYGVGKMGDLAFLLPISKNTLVRLGIV